MNNWTRGRLLGRGSSASVYLATNSKSDQHFAVKSFKLSNSQHAQNEQSIVSSLNSPFIISYFGSHISTESHDLLFELAPNGSLSDEIKRNGNKLNEPSIQYHTYQILCGLSYLHNRGIIHRDIKAQNILLFPHYKTKIADFGCAKHDLDKTQNPKFCGTPIYFAPETARGEKQGKEADVWALGCTVIEMASGSVSWPKFEDPISVLNHIGNSCDLPLIPDWISEQGKDFLAKCLNREAKQRWTVEELLKHPFLAQNRELESGIFEKWELESRILEKGELEFGILEKGELESWISPRSVLDLWGSCESCEMEGIKERIGALGTGEDCEWTMSLVGNNELSNWINVRDHGNYEFSYESDLGSTGDDHESDLVRTGDDHESDLGHDSHEFDNVNYNDLVLSLESGCWENEIILLDFVDYCSNEYCKVERNELIKMGSFCCWHNSLCFLVIFMIDFFHFFLLFFTCYVMRWRYFFTI